MTNLSSAVAAAMSPGAHLSHAARINAEIYLPAICKEFGLCRRFLLPAERARHFASLTFRRAS
jgi:hypothetical protein